MGRAVRMVTRQRDVIVVGASAGGVDALRAFIGALPGDLGAALFIVMHIPSGGTSALPQILGRVTTLPVRHPADGEPVRPGHVYVAPPDRHLLLSDDRIRLSRGPRQNGHRPAVDPLFRSAARAYGSRVVAVVLSGTLDDGAAGAARVVRQGGLVAAQDPEDAAYAGMPRSAIASSGTDVILPVRALAERVGELCGRYEPRRESTATVRPQDAEEVEDVAEKPWDPPAEPDEEGLLAGPSPPGPEQRTGTVYVCPDCGGPLFELDEANHLWYRCRVGHGWSIDGLLDEQATAVENALWTAVRSLDERAELSGRLAETAKDRGNRLSAGTFAEMGADARSAAEVIRRLLQGGDLTGPGPGSGYPSPPAERPYDEAEATPPQG